MFRGGFEVNDETYTFGIRSWSRQNLHVLTSIDYSKMSEADKLKEEYPREDHDYGLSWIRREGKGRVFYAAHGHSERVYAIKPMLEHILAGTQYALGDLKAIGFHPEVKVGTLPLERVGEFGEPDVLFFNVNTPEDLERAEAVWRRHG